MYIVTGANGFIGSALVWELNQHGIEDIICVDTVSTKERPGPLKNAKYQKFVSTDELPQALQSEDLKSSVACIFHMGACSTTTETDEEYLRKNNTEYTQNLFDFCTTVKIPFIYASSASVYGDGSNGFDDKTPTEDFQPMHGYGRSKSFFDIWAMQQTETPPHWYGLRFFNVYGPNEYHKGSMCSVAFKAYNQIKQTDRLKLFKSLNPDYEDGKQMRDFVYVKDVTRWMYELYKEHKASSGIYNMGYGQARTWLDLATAAFEALDKPVDIDWIDLPDNLKNQYQYFTEAKMDKLLSQGISDPEWSVDRGVKDYITNYLSKQDPYLK